MSKIGTGDAGEKVFRAAGKTRDLVRHGGAEDYDRIVYSGSQQAIEINRNCFRDQSAGQFRDLRSAQLADGREFFGNIPLMIVDVAESRRRVSVSFANLQSLFFV